MIFSASSGGVERFDSLLAGAESLAVLTLRVSRLNSGGVPQYEGSHLAVAGVVNTGPV